jgi:hypothetical protein
VTLLASDEWVLYALNLVDNDRGVGLHDLFLEPKARQLENALVALLTAGDVPSLIACARGGDPAESLAAVRLLVRLVLAGDARVASAAGGVVEALRSVCESTYPERMVGRLALLAWLEAAPKDAAGFLRRHAIEDVLALEAEIRVPIVGGGELALEPGEHVLRINLLDIPPPGYEDEQAWLLARVELTDSTGRILRAHLPFRTYSFVEMLRKGAPATVGDGTVVLSSIRCFSDRRRWLPVVDQRGGQIVAHAYHEKYLCLSTTIRRGGARGIILDVAGYGHGGIGGAAVPAIAVSGHFIAKDLLAPRPWMGGRLRFHVTNEIGTPQRGVRVTRRDPVSALVGQLVERTSSILDDILSDCIQEGACGALSEYAGWLAGARLSAAEARLLTVDPARMPHGGDRLFSALEHLVRNFESTAALVRIRELCAAPGAISDRAHVALARVGHADSERIRLVLEQWRETRSGETATWLYQVAHGGISITGATEASILEQVRALFGSASRETASSLRYDAGDESGIQLHVSVVQMGRDLHQAHFGWGTGGPRPPATPPPRHDPPMRARFALGTDVLLAIDDGRHLRIGRGGLAGEFRLEGGPLYEIRPDTSSVVLALYVSDEEGRVFKATRLLTASLLLESWRAGEVGHLCRLDQVPRWLSPPSSESPFDRVKIFWAEARLVVAGQQRENPQLSEPQSLDLTGRETDAMLHPGADSLAAVLRLSDEPGGLSGFFTSQQIATTVLMPSLLGAGARPYEPTVLVDTGRVETPTPGVRLEG